MKDATSATTTDLGDTGGGCSSDGGGGGTTRSNSPSSSSPDMNTLSPPSSITSPTAAALATAAAAAFTSLHHGSSADGISPLLSHSQMFRTVPSADVIRQTTAALMAVGANHLTLPVGLQSSLTSGSALFPHQHGGLFNWPQTSSPPPTNPTVTTHSANNNRMTLKTTTAKKNNNNVVSSSSAAVTRKNQANAKKRTVKKTDPAETAIIEVAAMTHITNPAPLSPPTSGSSPPTDVVSSGKGTNISSEKDMMAGRDKSFVCRTCNRSFGYKHVLQNHERTHTGEKPFKCQVCEKRFTRDHHLKTHMRLHTGEKPYLCTHCDRQFVQVANLRRHLRVHTGERPYSCTECSSKFSDSNQLKAHTLIHRGEKPFKCDKCRNKFRRRHHLMHHKCPGRDDSIPIILNNLKENVSSRDQKSPENFDRIEETRNNRHDLFQTMIQSYSSVKDEVGDIYAQDEDNSIHMSRTRVLTPSMAAIFMGRKTHTEDLEDDDEEEMLVEEEEEGMEEHEDLVTSHRNGLILSHNNNGSLLERKGRIRKPQEIRRVIRIPNSTSPSITSSPGSMLMTNPLPLSSALLPEQTEPEDLSMSTGHQNGYRNNNHVHSNSHSSGDSPLSRSPSSDPDEEEDELEAKLPPSNLFLQHRHPKFRRHHENLQRNNGTAPVS